MSDFISPPDRIISGNAHNLEESLYSNLRPQTLDQYIGQTKVKDNLSLFMEAAKARGEALDHVLLSGPPGLGKTTLAHIIAQSMGTKLHSVTGPNIEKKADLAAVLTNLGEGDVLFIDEIHRLQKSLEEILYSAMEDFKLEIILGQGPAAQTLRLDLARFTLVGATTRTGLLTNPLRDRFGVQLRLEFYTPEELKNIILRSSHILNLELDGAASIEIARRARATPRIANRLLKRVRDFNQVKNGGGVVTETLAKTALALFEVDAHGLDPFDRKYLSILIDKFNGGPAGVETLAAALGDDRETLEEVVEPYLLQEGYIQRTPRGRQATKKAFEHLCREYTATLSEGVLNLPQIGV